MAFSMTYSSLVQSIQDYSERTDSIFVSHIPEFIAMAENRIAQEIHNLGFRRIINGTMVIGNPDLAKPVRWRETASISIVIPSTNERVYLYKRSFQYLQSYWPNSAAQDLPRFYADSDYDHWLFAPTPDLAYPIQIIYHERPTPLDNTNQANWTTEYAPNLLLSASLLAAQPFLMRPDRQQAWEAMYQTAAAAIIKEGQARMNGDQANTVTMG